MHNETAGIVLAGGRSTRMGGGDKCLRDLGGRPILSHIVERARGQVGALALNANGDSSRFSAFGLPVIADTVEGFAGPLAGVLAGLEWAGTPGSTATWVASFASDAPFFPRDLVERMHAAVIREHADMACARSAGQVHPVFGLWPVSLRADLRSAVVDERIYKVDRWTARYRCAVVDFSSEPIDPFFNTNTPDDLEAARRLLAEMID
ncbi:MAG: molybdenum cofactor guanylyltransferase MobA [Alphaproteobacteria bacterium]|nr:molybdenum cofactor guanylyltransferase MobA [Alphaproteobacteria bacterium]